MVIDLFKEQKLGLAFTRQTEGRWWIFHWTPNGIVVRLLMSYPDRTSAVHAISTLGYRAVPATHRPEGADNV